MFATRWGREMLGQPGGSAGVDDTFARLHDPGIGAEIIGANKFGHPDGTRTRFSVRTKRNP